MAFNLSKLNFFSRLDARARVFVLLGGVLGFIFLIYLGTRYFSSSDETVGPSKVANAPQGLQSVPGGQLTPEYYRALKQANAQASQQAQMSGTSAISTMINAGDQMATGAGCIICSDQSANVKNSLDDWAKQGKIAPEVASELTSLADKNVTTEEYAAALDRLVREGKITPEQARQLLETYKQQHTNALLKESAKMMDEQIKSGQLPLDAANQLLAIQKNKVSPADYAAQLDQMVQDGKISKEQGQRLLGQYKQQFTLETIQQSIAILKEMSQAGQISPEILNELIAQENQLVPLDDVIATLQKYEGQGKITPVISKKIIEEYKQQKDAIGSSNSIDAMQKQAEAAAYQELADLTQSGKITPEVAQQITAMLNENPSLEDFKGRISRMVLDKKLTPEIATLKIADYERIKKIRDAKKELAALLANNATADQYEAALKKLVAEGKLTPEQAAQLMKEYQRLTVKAPVVTTGTATTDAFAKLQQQVQDSTPPPPTTDATAQDFAVEQIATAQQIDQDKQARLQAMMGAMSGQAQQLIAAWQPYKMEHKEGTAETAKTDTTTTTAQSGSGTGTTTTTTTMSTTAPIIKAGTILFAVLDTEVNSDYPDSPVMATIVEGKYKGAKLLGKLQTTKGVTGQQDRITLNFQLMNLDSWPQSKSITSFAIDPDKARTVLASSVDYHYMMRFGSMMATSLLQGYGNAVNSSGGQTQVTAFGNTTSNPTLSPTNKIMSALGQMGQTLGAATANYINRPPTVRVDSGVSLGILFMADVS